MVFHHKLLGALVLSAACDSPISNLCFQGTAALRAALGPRSGLTGFGSYGFHEASLFAQRTYMHLCMHIYIQTNKTDGTMLADPTTRQVTRPLRCSNRLSSQFICLEPALIADGTGFSKQATLVVQVLHPSIQPAPMIAS